MEYRVFFIDDEPDLLKALTTEFEKLGCRTRCALNGIEALEHIQSQDIFDVIVSPRALMRLGRPLIWGPVTLWKSR